jgi:hypothetical protein
MYVKGGTTRGKMTMNNDNWEMPRRAFVAAHTLVLHSRVVLPILRHCYKTQVSGTSYFPILGAMTKMHFTEPWVAHQRRDYANGAGEVYVPVLSAETKPSGEAILANFER